LGFLIDNWELSASLPSALGVARGRVIYLTSIIPGSVDTTNWLLFGGVLFCCKKTVYEDMLNLNIADLF
jgi:hypothetical protein